MAALPVLPWGGGYSTLPAPAALARMTDAELSAVRGFTVARRDHGQIRWLGAVDVRGLDVARAVRIGPPDDAPDGDPGVDVYPDADFAPAEKPRVGELLNARALVTLVLDAGADEAELRALCAASRA